MRTKLNFNVFILIVPNKQHFGGRLQDNLSFLFSSPDPKSHVRYCHHLASVVRPLTFLILIYSSETTGPNGTKLGRKHLYKVLHKVSSFRPIPPTNMAAKDNSCFWLTNVKKIFSSETAWPNGAKLGIDGPWVCPFQNCVWQPHPPFKMAAVF